MNMIQVNGDPLAWSAGMTVRDVLTLRRFTFPMLVITVDGDLVAVRAQPIAQNLQGGAADAVIVGEQDAHGAPSRGDF